MRQLAMFALAAGLLAACGVPIEAEAERLDIEFDQPVEIEELEPEDLAAVSVYLVRDDRLVHVTRDLPLPTSVEDTLQSLLGGASVPEERANLRTAIPSATTLLGVDLDSTEATIDLSREFASVGGEEEILAVAQIVLTVTSFEGVERVVFELEGVTTDVHLVNGALSERPVEADDYIALLAP